ncbi:hypothetical protein NZD89_11875 [Alicyclobacillus fastidiosus]|uniref:Uncharacterized protein n=1 Tax=Alicyclobacillus fastidiosus TaxID=392011 RepID=A0ABY6ZM59_9BACL|nr:hypothetical protein [Alicyclobacillus fastidiosus]WAH44008.1 hypothetical protein NZD89_11875 [Alicyclobacillus fastidiosus]GMA60290.1 hypothetical protein GCM10025859_07300 [Alicyclobacillus fastidiosus]
MSETGTHPVWGASLKALRRSLYAQQVFSSMVREWDEKGLLTDDSIRASLHRATDAASSCRVAALGHCIRLHFLRSGGEQEEERVISDLVALLYEARRADVEGGDIVEALIRSGRLPTEWKRPARTWHKQRCEWLKASAATLKRRVAPELYARGKAKL